MDDEAQLFALAASAQALGDGQWRTDDDQDAPMAEDERLDVEVVQLACGDYHVCTGMACKHVEQSSDTDRYYICKLSGRVIGNLCEAAHDSSWTGRSCSSADPDMQSATVGSSAWRFKRSAFAASAAAYSLANSKSFDAAHGGDAFAPEYRDPKPTAKEDESKLSDVKRGAPCVVDVDEVAIQSQKRNKALKRIDALKQGTVQNRLLVDASNVVVKMFSVIHKGGAAPSKRDQAVSGGAATLQDPRLSNYDFVLNMALKRYTARLKEQKAPPTLSGIHDVCLAANQFVKSRQKETQSEGQSHNNDRRIATNGKTIELCSNLILSLWTAMCTTPYFVNFQSGDSFRPFAAGVLYALKRGLRLPNNMVLVPDVEPLARHLPTLRSSTATPAARQLQQSSHRGLCAIQRGIASIDKMSEDEQKVALSQLKLVSKIASRLSNYVKENT